MSDLPTPIPAELARLRGSIDNIDAALVYLLAERFKATQQVGVLKATTGLPPSDPAREEQQVARLRELAAHGRTSTRCSRRSSSRSSSKRSSGTTRPSPQGHAQRAPDRRRAIAAPGWRRVPQGRKVGGVSSGRPRG